MGCKCCSSFSKNIMNKRFIIGVIVLLLVVVLWVGSSEVTKVQRESYSAIYSLNLVVYSVAFRSRQFFPCCSVYERLKLD